MQKDVTQNVHYNKAFGKKKTTEIEWINKLWYTAETS